MAVVSTKMAAVSRRSRLVTGRSGVIAQSTTTGAMIRPAAASASHQVTEVASHPAGLPNSTSSAKIAPASAAAEPSIAVGAKAMSANFAAPAAVSNVRRPFDQRLISQAPAPAATRVPTAAKPGVKKACEAMTPKANDPNRIAGQTR